MKEIILKVKGIACSGCESEIKNILSFIEGLVKVEPSHVTGEVRIVYDESKISEDLIEKAVQNTGREVIK